jgi:chromosome segregation protein
MQGFKSFYDRTEMKFSGSGIAAVVGPNGCGKSNLSDAISWVLGEQSAKSLRGARMEDVIFAGTRDKKPLSMASVTMTLVPDEATLNPITLGPVNEVTTGEPPQPEGEQNTDPAPATNGVVKPELTKVAEKRGEITITRRLYRSGDSEYLINGRHARLRDIQELFLGTGLGPESYAIIEQGRIGQILSNKPQDRRSIIEEAAGITKFKTRKRLAEAKLESAKQNLARVFDILEEVNRQVNSLKRQAAKTRRYGELKAEGMGYLRELLTARFQMLERETAKLTIEVNLASTRLQSAQAAIEYQEKQQTGVLESSYEIEQQLTTARKTLADLQLEAERARGKVEYQTKQIQQIEARLTAGAQEVENVSRQQGERAAELEQSLAGLREVDAHLAQARELLNVKAADRQQAQAKLNEQERGLEAARQRVLRLLGDSSALKNRISQAEAQFTGLERDGGRARAEEEQSVSDLGRIQKVKGELSDRLSAQQTELISVADQRKQVEEELRVNRAQIGDARHLVERLRAEYSRVKARQDSLLEVIQHRSYTTETVKRLFSAVERGKAPDFKPVGVLADFVEVDPQLEKATEEFLHEELEYVVVRDWQDAERGVELMRGDLSGRATFLVEDSHEAETAELPMPPLEPGRLMRLIDALRFTNGIASLPWAALPRIAHCFVTTERSLAQQLAAEFPHCWFLSPDGVSYHGRALSGGKKSGAGPLGLKRELREVSQLARVKEQEQKAAHEALAELERTIAVLAEQLDHLRSLQQRQEKEVLSLDHENRKLAEESQRAQTRLSHARLELDRVGKDRVRLEEAIAQERAALEAAEAARAEQEAALEAAREELRGLQADVARAAEEHASIRAGLASLEERQRSISAHRSRLENQLHDLNNRREHLSREAERLGAEREQFLASNKELEQRRVELDEAIAQEQKRVAELAEQEATLRAQLGSLEESLKALRLEANAAQENRAELQVAMARAESDLKHLEETCQKELETSLPQLVEGVETVPDESGLAELDAKYMEVRRKIESLGPVNPQALEELQEAEQRQEFLNTQRQDLIDSIRDTEKAIHEIDGESRKRFSEAFKSINENFREMFKTLFGGGTGEMRLSDEENLAESGIDIVAQPPGKKLQSVLLLSGGEKSLTAMALLMAIFQYAPSPFCILDEVDAPLDEPNTERLTRLIRSMAEQTQFILITHSKTTMEAAQSLYGVTMQEPGVSKLVSVKFKEQHRVVPITDQQQGERAAVGA